MSAIASVQIRKELRELLPFWLGAIAAMLAGTWLANTGHPVFGAVTVLAYIAGSISLGAISIGHEYVHRTLGSLLAQPSDRRSILAIKFLTLTPLLLSLGGVALWIFNATGTFPRQDVWLFQSLAIMPVLTGLFLTPWLTMVCRGPFAGSVFSITLSGMAFSTSTMLRYSPMDLLLTMLGLNIIAAVMAWRGFMRLEALDGPRTEIDLTGLLRWRPAKVEDRMTTGGGRTSLIIKKEIQLQHVTFVLAGLYVVIWIAISILNRSSSHFRADLYGVSTITGWIIAVVAGCVASAEERNLNTAQWQTLLPMSAGRQWMLKTGTALVVGVSLSVGLPLLLHRSLDDWHFRERLYLESALVVAGLYVSSFSTSGMRAILACFPIFAAFGFVVNWLIRPNAITADRWFRPFASAVERVVRIDHFPAVIDRMWMVAFATGLATLLYFGLKNHRMADSPPRRILSQFAILAAGAVATVYLDAFLYAMYWARLSR